MMQISQRDTRPPFPPFSAFHFFSLDVIHPFFLLFPSFLSCTLLCHLISPFLAFIPILPPSIFSYRPPYFPSFQTFPILSLLSLSLSFIPLLILLFTLPSLSCLLFLLSVSYPHSFPQVHISLPTYFYLSLSPSTYCCWTLTD